MLIVASQNTLIRSGDNGKSWSEVCPPLKNKNVRSLAVNADTILSLSATGSLSITTNSGMSWHELPTSDNLQSISFSNGVLFGLSAAGKPVTSNNWGSNWIEWKGALLFSEIAAIDQQVYGLTQGGEVYADVLGKPKMILTTPFKRNARLLSANGSVVVIADSAFFVCTPNEEVKRFAVGSDLWASARCHANYLWVGFHRGGLEKYDLRSGERILQLDGEFGSSAVRDIGFVGKSVFVATTGDGGGLHRSDVESISFRPIPAMITSNTVDISVLAFSDSAVIVGSRENGCYKVTEDSRAMVPIGDGVDNSIISSIYRYNDAWIVVSRMLGIFGLSKCDGELKRITPPIVNGNEFYSASSNSGIFVSVNDNAIYFSSDGGRQWEPRKMPNTTMYVTQLFGVDGEELMMCTNKGIYFSRDGARSWTRYANSTDSTSAEWGVLTTFGLFYSFGNVLFFVSERGETSTINFDGTDGAKKYCFDIMEHNNRLFASVEGGIYYSKKGSLSWTFVPIPDIKFIRKTFVNKERLYIVTDSGRLGVFQLKNVIE